MSHNLRANDNNIKIVIEKATFYITTFNLRFLRLLLVGVVAFPKVVSATTECFPGGPCDDNLIVTECPTDTFTCPDGSAVDRDPLRNCEFRLCDEETPTRVTCDEVLPKRCLDGHLCLSCSK